jgi:hypothetical protein
LKIKRCIRWAITSFAGKPATWIPMLPAAEGCAQSTLTAANTERVKRPRVKPRKSVTKIMTICFFDNWYLVFRECTIHRIPPTTIIMAETRYRSDSLKKTYLHAAIPPRILIKPNINPAARKIKPDVFCFVIESEK